MLAVVAAVAIMAVLVVWWCSQTSIRNESAGVEANRLTEELARLNSSSEVSNSPVILAQREELDPLEAANASPEAVRIVVVDRNDQTAISNATIVVFEHGARTDMLRTAEDGTVLVEDIRWEDVVIEVEGPNHFAERRDSAEIRDQLVAGRTIRVELDRLGKLLVRVVDGDGRPIAGAFVEALPESKDRPGTVVYPLPWPEFQPPGRQTVFEPNRNAIASSTNQLGEIEIPFLPCDRPLIVRATLNVPEVSRRVSIPRDPGFLRVELPAANSAEVVGTLHWDTGTPAAGVEIVCYVHQSALWPLSATTDAEGRFRFARVRHGLVDFRPDIFGEDARAIEVENERTDIGVWTIDSRVALSGQVVDRFRPFPQYSSSFSVTVLTQSGRLNALTRTDGTFELSVPRGQAVLSVGHVLGLESLLEIQVDPPVSNLAIDVTDRLGRVRLQPSGPSPGDVISVGLRPLGAAAGRARDCEPKPHGVWATNESDREIEQRVPLVEWTDESVVVTALSPGAYEAWIDAGARGSAWLNSIQVQAGQTTDLGTIETGWSSLEVIALDASGRALSGIDVSAVWNIANGSVSNRTINGNTDEHGVWSLDQALPGPWTIFLSNYGPCDPSAVKVIAEVRQRSIIRLTGESPGSIRGRVLSGGTPSARATVSLLRFEHLNTSLPQPVCDARSDESGSYRFESVAPGEYLARLTLANSAPSVGRTVTVRSGEESFVDFLVNDDVMDVRFLIDGEIDHSISSGSVWTTSGWATLQPGSSPGTFAMPRWVGGCLFELNRTGVPGAGYMGHRRLAGYQRSVFAWTLPTASGATVLDVDAPSPKRELVLCDPSVQSASAYVVGARLNGPLSDLPFRIGVGAIRRPHGWISHGLGTGLEVELMTTDSNGRTLKLSLQTRD